MSPNRGAFGDRTVEDDGYLVGPADVEMVADQPLEEGPTSLGRSMTRVSDTSNWRKANS